MSLCRKRLCVGRGDGSDNSTDQLTMSSRPGTVLEMAGKSDEYLESLEAFKSNEPLDLSYASLHSYWLHVESTRVQHPAAPGAPRAG